MRHALDLRVFHSKARLGAYKVPRLRAAQHGVGPSVAVRTAHAAELARHGPAAIVARLRKHRTAPTRWTKTTMFATARQYKELLQWQLR